MADEGAANPNMTKTAHPICRITPPIYASDGADPPPVLWLAPSTRAVWALIVGLRRDICAGTVRRSGDGATVSFGSGHQAEVGASSDVT
jgi:hypothetical protein